MKTKIDDNNENFNDMENIYKSELSFKKEDLNKKLTKILE